MWFLAAAGALPAPARLPVAAPTPDQMRLLAPCVAAAKLALTTTDDQGKDRDGSWCVAQLQQSLVDSVASLRGRKLAWWIDAPRALRCFMRATSR